MRAFCDGSLLNPALLRARSVWNRRQIRNLNVFHPEIARGVERFGRNGEARPRSPRVHVEWRSRPFRPMFQDCVNIHRAAPRIDLPEGPQLVEAARIGEIAIIRHRLTRRSDCSDGFAKSLLLRQGLTGMSDDVTFVRIDLVIIIPAIAHAQIELQPEGISAASRRGDVAIARPVDGVIRHHCAQEAGSAATSPYIRNPVAVSGGPRSLKPSALTIEAGVDSGPGAKAARFLIIGCSASSPALTEKIRRRGNAPTPTSSF